MMKNNDNRKKYEKKNITINITNKIIRITGLKEDEEVERETEEQKKRRIIGRSSRRRIRTAT